MNPIDTKENVADLFTKPLGNDQFWYLSNQVIGDNDLDKFGDLLRCEGSKYIKSNGGSGENRSAPKSKLSIMTLMLDMMVDIPATKQPWREARKNTSTGRIYESIHNFYRAVREKPRENARDNQEYFIATDHHN